MPSGKTHDLITLLILPPTFVAAYLLSSDIYLSTIVVAATLFGGFMFGPDLDTNSTQYQRWGVVKFLWWPYKTVFSHRSRFTHGIFLGTVVRIVYFIAVSSLVVALALFVKEVWMGNRVDEQTLIALSFQKVFTLICSIDKKTTIALVSGLWWGAASHTITDFFVTTTKNLLKLL